MSSKYLRACLPILLALLLLSGVGFVTRIAQPVAAQTVQGYSLVTLFDGSVPYTSTQYSSALLGGYFSKLQIQAATTAVTSVHVLSVTPQFSNQAVACGAITDWVDGALVELAPFDTYTSTSTATVVRSGLTTQTITSTVELYAEAGTTETVTSTVVTVGAVGTGDTVTDTTTVDTAGQTTQLSLAEVAMLFRLEGAAPSAVMRAFPILGQCIRFKLESSASDQVYTPTLYVRLIND